MEPVSIILIAYNEAATIREEVECFYRVVVEKIPGSELIVAEDGSTDGTSSILRELSKALPIRLVQGESRKGYKRALLDAFSLPEREWIFFCDTGGKFDPEAFWKLETARDHADLIIGAKVKREDQFYRRFLTKSFNFIIRCYFDAAVRDIDSGLRIYRKDMLLKALDTPLILNEMVASEITLRMLAGGARLTEVPVFYSRRQGISRGLPLKKIPRVIGHVLHAFPQLKRELARRRDNVE